MADRPEIWLKGIFGSIVSPPWVLWLHDTNWRKNSKKMIPPKKSTTFFVGPWPKMHLRASLFDKSIRSSYVGVYGDKSFNEIDHPGEERKSLTVGYTPERHQSTSSLRGSSKKSPELAS